VCIALALLRATPGGYLAEGGIAEVSTMSSSFGATGGSLPIPLKGDYGVWSV
jgi:hypothetical protein